MKHKCLRLDPLLKIRNLVDLFRKRSEPMMKERGYIMYIIYKRMAEKWTKYAAYFYKKAYF